MTEPTLAKINIEYCGECGDAPVALKAAGELLSAYEDRIAHITLIPSWDGVFEVVVNGALVFLMVFSIVLLAAFVAGRNIKLFVQHGRAGCVGPLGGVRACQLDDLTEIRTV